MGRLRLKGACDLIEKRQLRNDQIERCDVLQRDNDRLVAELRAMGVTTTDFRTCWAQIGELASIEASAPPPPAAKPMCVICEETAPEVAFIPCGHRVTCKTCGDACRSRCPICREPVTGMLRVFDL